MMVNKHSSILIVLISWLIVGISSAQTQVDYTAKALKKEIEKCWSSDIDELIQIDINANIPIEGRFFTMVGAQTKYVYVGRVNSCRTGGCSIGNETSGTSEYFDYFILFDGHAKVELVKIFNYAATHGHEVMARGWLKQFMDYNNKTELIVGKDVDSISGATVSVNAITEDIRQKTNLIAEYIQSTAGSKLKRSVKLTAKSGVR